MSSPDKFCGPCAETECLEVTEDESAALKSLYARMLDRPAAATVTCDGGPAAAVAAPSPLARRAACATAEDDVRPRSLLQRFDELMAAALDSRTAGTSDSANDKAALPDAVLFAKCRPLPAGRLNTALYGIDVERTVVGAPVERDGLSDAVDALLKAEAACKHSGAVRAAELAAMAQPEAKHAEDAARIGAKAYTTADEGKTGGLNSEYPVAVVGYVGCTRPPRAGAAKRDDEKCD